MLSAVCSWICREPMAQNSEFSQKHWTLRGLLGALGAVENRHSIRIRLFRWELPTKHLDILIRKLCQYRS